MSRHRTSCKWVGSKAKEKCDSNSSTAYANVDKGCPVLMLEEIKPVQVIISNLVKNQEKGGRGKASASY